MYADFITGNPGFKNINPIGIELTVHITMHKGASAAAGAISNVVTI